MKLEDIIEDLNRYLHDTRNELKIENKGHFVLHKQIIPSERIKAYKEFDYTLWYIEGRHKGRSLTLKEVHRAIQGDDRIVECVDNKFIQGLFMFIRSEEFDKILKGEYFYVVQ